MTSLKSKVVSSQCYLSSSTGCVDSSCFSRVVVLLFKASARSACTTSSVTGTFQSLNISLRRTPSGLRFCFLHAAMFRAICCWSFSWRYLDMEQPILSQLNHACLVGCPFECLGERYGFWNSLNRCWLLNLLPNHMSPSAFIPSDSALS